MDPTILGLIIITIPTIIHTIPNRKLISKYFWFSFEIKKLIVGIKPVTKSIKFLGEAISEEVYLDVFGGWKEKEKLQGNRKLIRLR